MSIELEVSSDDEDDECTIGASNPHDVWDRLPGRSRRTLKRIDRVAGVVRRFILGGGFSRLPPHARPTLHPFTFEFTVPFLNDCVHFVLCRDEIVGAAIWKGECLDLFKHFCSGAKHRPTLRQSDLRAWSRWLLTVRRSKMRMKFFGLQDGGATWAEVAGRVRVGERDTNVGAKRIGTQALIRRNVYRRVRMR